MRDGGRRGVAIAFIDPDVHAPLDQDAQCRPGRRLRERVRVAPEEEWAAIAALDAVAVDRFGRREDVGLIEGVPERRAAVTGGPERDSLGGVRRVGAAIVVSPDERVDVDERGRVRGLSRAFVEHHLGMMSRLGFAVSGSHPHHTGPHQTPPDRFQPAPP